MKEIIGNKRISPKDGSKCLAGRATAELNMNKDEPLIEDIYNGYELFHSAEFCPTVVVKIYTFIDQLLSNQTTRTIIQTIVGLFQSIALTDEKSFNLTKQFYQVLASTLDLQYGNIILATSTNAQRQAVITTKWPYFTNYTDLVEKCLFESSCDILQEIYQNLGESIF